MQLRHAQRLGGEVDTRNTRTAARHGLGQNAATAAHVQHLLARQGGDAVDPRQAQRIDLMQGAKLALGIPPAVGQLGEFFQLGWVGIDGSAHACIVTPGNGDALCRFSHPPGEPWRKALK